MTQGLTSAYQIYQGVDSAVSVAEAVEDMPRSQAMEPAVIGMASAGAAIGTGIAGAVAVGSAVAAGGLTAAAATGAAVGSVVPGLGTAIGAAVGVIAGVAIASTGSGKGSAQAMRDGWRDSLHKSGIVDDEYNVTLADGSKFNIGLDGGHQWDNVDGTKRGATEIDWNDPVAASGVLDGHVFALATGLDPTSNEKFGLFHSTAGMAVNAASSNAQSPEEMRANIASMLSDGGVSPEAAGFRLEVLRLTNKISEQEYGLYVHHSNQIFVNELCTKRPRNSSEFTGSSVAKRYFRE